MKINVSRETKPNPKHKVLFVLFSERKEEEGFRRKPKKNKSLSSAFKECAMKGRTKQNPSRNVKFFWFFSPKEKKTPFERIQRMHNERGAINKSISER